MKGGRHWWMQCLGEITQGKAEISLGHACRELDRMFKREGVSDNIWPAMVSQRLRDLGFAKIGMTGTGYDREPLYRRQTPAEAAR